MSNICWYDVRGLKFPISWWDIPNNGHLFLEYHKDVDLDSVNSITTGGFHCWAIKLRKTIKVAGNFILDIPLSQMIASGIWS